MTAISEQEYVTRIRQLEQLNATLAAQVDRMRPVVEAAQAWRIRDAERFRLAAAVETYEQQMAALTRKRKS